MPPSPSAWRHPSAAYQLTPEAQQYVASVLDYLAARHRQDGLEITEGMIVLKTPTGRHIFYEFPLPAVPVPTGGSWIPTSVSSTPSRDSQTLANCESREDSSSQ